MPDIKTRNVIRGTIKTLDRSAVLQDKVKGNLTRTKDMTEQTAVNDGQQDAFCYAESKSVAGLRETGRRTARAFDRAGRWGVKETKETAEYVKGRIQNGRIDGAKPKGAGGTGVEKTAGRTNGNRENMKKAASQSRLYGRAGVANKNATPAITSRKRKSSVSQAKAFAKRSILSRQAAVQTARRTLLAQRSSARSLSAAVKGIAAGAKAAFAAVLAGGWIAVLIVLIVVVLGASITFFGNQESSFLPVSEQVEAYDPLIRKYAEVHGISEYVDLIKAVMMQESGGRGTDPMQASECGFNKKYPHAPNSITDPEYSINVGIQNIAACLKQAGVESPVDVDNIKLALQGYNFGNGFISWAKEKYGGYSEAAANEFSEMMAKRNGWSSYGDVDYVSHVTRYYPHSGYSYGMMFYSTGVLGLPIEGMTKADVSSPFGARWGTTHTGTDFAFPVGTPIYASESGTVTLAGWNGGYGKCIIIDHGNGMKTLYGHLSKINVAKGQKVIRGQCIGETGNTGRSTGPHLHFEIIINGKYVDPMSGYLNMP